MIKYCCSDIEKLLCERGPIFIKEDLSLEALGYHEPISDDRVLDLKLKFCPFCGKRLVGAANL